jgi:signal transduction histidine kinase
VTALDVVAPVAFGVLAAAALGAVVAGIVLRRQQTLAGALRAARERLAALEEISEVWQWQTDAAHRLAALRPPAAARAPADIAAADPSPFWARFAVPGRGDLEAHMKAAAVLDDIAVDADHWEGAKRSFRVRGRPLRDGAGGFAGYIGSLRETPLVPAGPPSVGAAARVAPAPTDAPSQAEHEALGTLVSHDLRAPIRVVEGFTRIVKEDYANVLDAIGHDHLDRILGAAGRMNHMIDALLALSRLASQPIARVPVDLSQLAAYVVEDLRRLRPEHEVEVEIEPGMAALGDPTLLRMVLENLLGNAWKYTGNTSRPRVTFGRAGDAAATFVVRDNGAGFDMRYADRLFGVFQRLHSASEFPGTGVGLASVRRIVRRHGGEIRAAGEPDRGASFHFSLPPDAAAA